MLVRRSLTFFLVLGFWFSPAFTQSAAQTPAQPAQAQQPAQPAQPQAPMTAASPLSDPAAYLLQEFGPSFKLAPKMQPLVGDLNGDGIEDLVLFATSATPLLSREQFNFRVEDPYDAYFGTGDVAITSEFTLHFDNSGRDILIVFGWRQPAAVANPKRVSKFVLINTPMETASIVSLRLKKKDLKAIETIDSSSLHSLVLWDGKKWRWSPQGMEGESIPGAK